MKNILKILVVVVLLSSCYGQQIATIREDTKNTLNSLVGKSQTEIVYALGAPTKKETVGGVEVWTYYRELYTRGAGHANVNNQYNRYTGHNAYGNTHGYTKTAYQKATLMFQNGRLVRWTYDDQY